MYHWGVKAVSAKSTKHPFLNILLWNQNLFNQFEILWMPCWYVCRQEILFERKRSQSGEAIKYTKVYQMGVVYHSGVDDCTPFHFVSVPSHTVPSITTVDGSMLSLTQEDHDIFKALNTCRSDINKIVFVLTGKKKKGVEDNKVDIQQG